MKTGEPVLKAGEKQKRPTSPPCYDCPKKSPEEAHKYELTERNVRAVQFYCRARATGWKGVPEWLASEPLHGKVMAIIERVMRIVEQDRSTEALIAPMVAIAVGKGRG